jgi:hypothetical protein
MERRNFYLVLGQLHLYFNQQNNQTYILLSPTVTNHGATSAATYWHVSFNSPMLRISVPYSNLPDPVSRWILPDGRRALTLQSEKMLPSITAEAVESGHSKSGRILFELPGNLVADILANPTQLYVGCSDRLGRITLQGLSQVNVMSDFACLPGEEVIVLPYSGTPYAAAVRFLYSRTGAFTNFIIVSRNR